MASTVEKLSPEVLVLLFGALNDETTCTFARVCRKWSGIAQDPVAQRNQIEASYDKHERIFQAIRRGPYCSVGLIKLLLKSCIVPGQLTRALRHTYYGPDFNTAYQHTFAQALRNLPRKWGTIYRVSKEVVQAVLAEPHDRVDNMFDFGVHGPLAQWQVCLLATKEVSVDGIVRDFAAASANARTVLPRLGDTVLLAVRLMKLVPMSKRYPLLPFDMVRMAWLEPRLVEILEGLGYAFDNNISDKFIRSILVTNSPKCTAEYCDCIVAGVVVMDHRANVLMRQIRDYIEMSNGRLFVTPSLVGECYSFATPIGPAFPLYPSPPEKDTAHARQVMDLLQNLGLLQGFEINDIIADLIHLSYNSTRSVSSAAEVVSLYERLPIARVTPLIYAVAFFARLASPGSHVFANWEAVIGWGSPPYRTSATTAPLAFPPEGTMWTKDQKIEAVVEILCNNYLLSPEIVLFNSDFLENVDMTECVARAARKMVRLPSKGTTLLSLVATYPFLVSIIRSEILLHRISLDLLDPGDNADPSRPLFSHRPPFLSPLAFDYGGAKLRYPLGLDGQNPFVENCYESGYKPVNESPVSYSPWLATPRRYSTKVKEVVIDRGQISGHNLRSMNAEPDKKGLASWVHEREVTRSLPVAIALLDLFEKNDEVLEIMLMHSLLNCNPSITTFYLKTGVPFRQVYLYPRITTRALLTSVTTSREQHAKALARMHLPDIKAIRKHLGLLPTSAAKSSAPVPSNRHNRRLAARRAAKGKGASTGVGTKVS